MINCTDNPCLFLFDKCTLHEVHHDRPILNDCPCKECILRPVCKSKCKVRIQHLEYVVDHLYETSKANHLIMLSKKMRDNEQYQQTEEIIVKSDPSTYDITLRM